MAASAAAAAKAPARSVSGERKAAEAAEGADSDVGSVRTLFMGERSAQDHVAAAKERSAEYVAFVRSAVERRVAFDFAVAVKAKMLAACFAAEHHATALWLLNCEGLITLPDILRTAQILDARRHVKQMRRKLQRMTAHLRDAEGREIARPRGKLRRGVVLLEQRIRDREADLLPSGGCSGAFSKHVRRWIARIPSEVLEFWLLLFDMAPWRELLDLVHARPADFKLGYFQAVVYGGEPPADSFVAEARKLRRENLVDLLRRFPRFATCYTFIRRAVKDSSARAAEEEKLVAALGVMGFSRHQALVAYEHAGADAARAADWVLENGGVWARAPPRAEDQALSDEARTLLAELAPLEDVLWYWEELECRGAEAKVTERLRAGEEIKPVHSRANYGKLMERLLLFRERRLAFCDMIVPHAQRLLEGIRAPPVDTIRVAVLGDASGSMEVAVRSASILSSLLSVVLRADLKFFNQEPIDPPLVPRNALDAIRVVESVRATGGTATAAALWPYYSTRTPVDLFVLVSDEGENERSHGFTFAEIFERYRAEVHDEARVILVSFLSGPADGPIQSSLAARGLPFVQLRLDGNRPDTSRFDALLGMAIMEASHTLQRHALIHDTINAAVNGSFSKDLLRFLLAF
jgi:hypothetical protein